MKLKVKLKRMILVCDEVVNSILLIDFIKQFASTAKINLAENLKQLSELLKETVPDMILIHSGKNRMNVAAILSKLRRNRKIDHVPVLVYLPSRVETGFSGLLKQIQSM